MTMTNESHDPFRDFSNAKSGDIVWSSVLGYGKVDILIRTNTLGVVFSNDRREIYDYTGHAYNEARRTLFWPKVTPDEFKRQADVKNELVEMTELISQLDDFCTQQFKSVLADLVDSIRNIYDIEYSDVDRREFIIGLPSHIKDTLKTYLKEMKEIT